MKKTEADVSKVGHEIAKGGKAVGKDLKKIKKKV